MRSGLPTDIEAISEAAFRYKKAKKIPEAMLLSLFAALPSEKLLQSTQMSHTHFLRNINTGKMFSNRESSLNLMKYFLIECFQQKDQPSYLLNIQAVHEIDDPYTALLIAIEVCVKYGRPVNAINEDPGLDKTKAKVEKTLKSLMKDAGYSKEECDKLFKEKQQAALASYNKIYPRELPEKKKPKNINKIESSQVVLDDKDSITKIGKEEIEDEDKQKLIAEQNSKIVTTSNSNNNNDTFQYSQQISTLFFPNQIINQIVPLSKSKVVKVNEGITSVDSTKELELLNVIEENDATLVAKFIKKFRASAEFDKIWHCLAYNSDNIEKRLSPAAILCAVYSLNDEKLSYIANNRKLVDIAISKMTLSDQMKSDLMAMCDCFEASKLNYKANRVEKDERRLSLINYLKTRNPNRFLNLSYLHLDRIDQLDMKSIKLRNVDLHGACLNHAYLNNLVIEDSNLRDVDLSNAILACPTFSLSDLSGANFYGSSLCGANFYGSTLCGANFTKTNLTGGIYFTHTNLSYANLSNLSFDIYPILVAANLEINHALVLDNDYDVVTSVKRFLIQKRAPKSLYSLAAENAVDRIKAMITSYEVKRGLVKEIIHVIDPKYKSTSFWSKQKPIPPELELLLIYKKELKDKIKDDKKNARKEISKNSKQETEKNELNKPRFSNLNSKK